MNKMIAVVEGSTEQIFIRQVLAPWLRERCGMELVASTAGTPGSKGGNSYDRAKRDILKHLKNPYFTHVTTFFDFYGMGQKWPGRQGTSKQVNRDQSKHLEEAIRKDIEVQVGSARINRFIPYVQMHEFEALLFSETSALPEVMQQPKTKQRLDEIRNDFETPEDINDSVAKAPSKRIEEIYHSFRKNFHGVIAAERITIDVMIWECPHFRKWVETLQEIGSKGGQ